MAAHAALLERLARLSAPAPAAQRTRRKDRDNAGFAEFFGAIFKPVAEAEPATWPLIVAAGFQLRHCLAPYLVVLLPLACAAWPPAGRLGFAFLCLWLAALAHSPFNWQVDVARTPHAHRTHTARTPHAHRTHNARTPQARPVCFRCL